MDGNLRICRADILGARVFEGFWHFGWWEDGFFEDEMFRMEVVRMEDWGGFRRSWLV